MVDHSFVFRRFSYHIGAASHYCGASAVNFEKRELHHRFSAACVPYNRTAMFVGGWRMDFRHLIGQQMSHVLFRVEVR